MITIAVDKLIEKDLNERITYKVTISTYHDNEFVRADHTMIHFGDTMEIKTGKYRLV